jgi:hypothetical protein
MTRKEQGLEARGADLAVMLMAALLNEDSELQSTPVLRRLSGHLRLCADLPELAAAMLGCEPEAVDPEVLRSAAGLLAGSAGAGGPPHLQAPTRSTIDKL